MISGLFLRFQEMRRIFSDLSMSALNVQLTGMKKFGQWGPGGCTSMESSSGRMRRNVNSRFTTFWIDNKINASKG
jgi:hypothetical protein